MAKPTAGDEAYQLELYWCIEKLQSALTSKKMNAKQAQDASRSLNVLKSQKAPLVKKRQVMRTTFGDYRAKMQEEEKKFSKARQKVVIVAATPSKKSQFFKKKCEVEGSSSQDETQKTLIYQPSNNSFKFNFSEDET